MSRANKYSKHLVLHESSVSEKKVLSVTACSFQKDISGSDYNSSTKNDRRFLLARRRRRCRHQSLATLKAHTRRYPQSSRRSLHLSGVINIKSLKCLACVASRPCVGVVARRRESAEPHVAGWKERTVENRQAWRGVPRVAKSERRRWRRWKWW